MADNPTNELLLSLRMERDALRGEMAQLLKEMRKIFGAQAMQVRVEGSADFKPAVREVEKLESAVQEVTAAAKEADAAISKMQQRVMQSARALNQVVPGSSKRLSEFYASGAGRAEGEVARITKKLQQQFGEYSRPRRRRFAGLVEGFEKLGDLRTYGRKRPETRQLLDLYLQEIRLTEQLAKAESRLAQANRRREQALNELRKAGGTGNEERLRSQMDVALERYRAAGRRLQEFRVRGYNMDDPATYRRPEVRKVVETRSAARAEFRSLRAQAMSFGPQQAELRAAREAVASANAQVEELRSQIFTLRRGQQPTIGGSEVTGFTGIEELEQILGKRTVNDVKRKLQEIDTRSADLEKAVQQAMQKAQQRLKRIKKHIAQATENPEGFWGQRRSALVAVRNRTMADIDVLSSTLAALQAGLPGEAWARAQGLVPPRANATDFRTRATAYLSALKERSSVQQTAQVPPVAPLLVSPTGQPISSQAQQVAAAMAPSPLAQIEEIEKRPMKLVVDEAILKTSIMNVISEIEGRGLHLAGAGVPGQAGGAKEFVLTREKEEAIAEAIARGQISEAVLQNLPVGNFERARITKSAVVRTKHEMRQSIDDDPVAFLRKHNAPKELIDIARRVTGPILRGSTDPKQIQDAMAVRAEFAAALEEFANQGGFGSKVRGRAALRGFEQRYLTPLHAIQQRLTTRNLGAAFSRRGAGGMTDEEATALRAQFAMQHGMLSPSTTESFTSAAELQARAYRERFTALRRYQMEFIRWMQATTEKERIAGAEKVKVARDNLRALEQAFIGAALTGSPMQQISRFTNRDGRIQLVRTSREGVLTDMVSAEGAYRLARGAVETQFGKAYDNYLFGLDRQRVDLLRRGEGDRAAALQPIGFRDFAQQLVAGNKEIENMYLRSIGFTKKMLQNDKLRAKALQENVAHMREFVKILQDAENRARQVNREIEILERGRQGRAVRAMRYGGFAQAANRFAMYSGLAYMGFAAFGAGRRALGSNVQLEQQIAGIQGVLPGRSAIDAEKISAAVRQASTKYGTDLNQTADAARVFAQAGFEATEVVKELDTTMLGVRGIGLTVEEMQELQIAVRAITRDIEKFDQTVDWTALVTDKIARVEARYAVMGQDLANSMKLLSPVVNQFTENMVGSLDVFDQVLGMTTVIVEQLRVSGNQAANSLKFMFSRLMRPQILTQLQDEFGARLGAPGGGFLPLNDILDELASTYQRLKREGQGDEKRFAVALSGGRQVNAIIALLEQYDRALEVAEQSSRAFGDAHERTNIALDTLQARIDQLRESMKSFAGNMMGSTQAATAFKTAVAGLNVVAEGAAKGGTLSTLMLLLGGGAVVQRGKSLFQRGMQARDLGVGIGGLYGKEIAEYRLALVNRERMAAGLPRVDKTFRGVGGNLLRIFGPGALLAAGLTAALALFGKLYDILTKVRREQERYNVEVQTLDKIGYFDSPQFQEFQTTARSAGFTNVDAAYEEARRALLSGPRLQKILEERGVESPMELLEQIQQAARNGSREFQGIREQIAEAFVSDLGKGVSNLDQITDKNERIALAIKLIGDVALAANLAILQTMQEIEAAANRMFDDARKFLVENETGGLFGSVRAMLGKVALDTKLPTGKRSYATGGLAPGQGAIDLLETERQVQFVNRFLKDMLPDVLEGVFMGENSVFAQAVEYSVRQAKEGDRVSDVLDRALADLAARPGDGWDLVVEELAHAAARDSGVLAAAAGRDRLPDWRSGETASERVFAGLDRLFKEAAARVPQLLGLTREQVDYAGKILEAYSKLVETNGERVAYALDGLAHKFGRFQDEVLNTLLRVYEDFARVRAESDLSMVGGRLRKAYDPAEGRLRALEEAYVSFSTLQERLDREILELLKQADHIGLQLPEAFADAVRAGDLTSLEEVIPGGEAFGQLTEQMKQITRTAEAIRDGQLQFANIDFFKEIIPDSADFTSDDRLRNFLSDLQAQAGVDGVLSGATFLEAVQKLIPIYDSIIARQEERLSIAERGVRIAEREAAIMNLIAEAEADPARAEALRVEASQLVLNAKINELQVQREQRRLTDDQLALKTEELRAAHELERFERLRTQVIRTQNQLIEQGRENITTALSGLRAVLSDMDTVNQKGRDIAFSVLGPLSEATYGRFMESSFEQLAKSLAQNETFAKMFQAPEVTMATAITNAHKLGAQYVAHQIVVAWSTVRGVPVPPGFDAPDLSGGNVGSGPSPWEQLAVMAGALGGAKLGGGGQGAGIGSSIGSMIPMMLGATGGLGIAFGLLGGLAGGLLGGLLDSDHAENKVISQLQAIERVQKETITAIEQQTSALLSPESRLINAPASFQFPAYTNTIHGGINITVQAAPGMNPEQVAQAVRREVSQLLSPNGRTRARGSR